MNSNNAAFHRTKRESQALGFVVLCFAFLLSVTFMVVGFAKPKDEAINPFHLIFGIAGIGLFAVFIHGSWKIFNGPIVHVFSVDFEEIEWGFFGKEQKFSVSEIRELYWDESDSFTFVIIPKIGKRVRLPYIVNVVRGIKSRGELLAFLRRVHPGIPIVGHIESQTEKAAAAKLAAVA